MNFNRSIVLGVAVAGALWVAQLLPAHGAVLVLEDFSDNDTGWSDIDGDDFAGITYSYVSGQYLMGTFGQQFFPFPETDGFQITAGTDFLGDYTGLTQIRFDFYAEDVLPSDLFINLLNGTDVYSYQFNIGALALDTWTTFTVNLLYDYGWSGPGGESGFNLALGSGGIDALQIEFTRGDGSEQSFYLDNVETLNTPIVESTVPEPSLAILMLLGGGLVYSMRRTLVKRTALALQA